MFIHIYLHFCYVAATSLNLFSRDEIANQQVVHPASCLHSLPDGMLSGNRVIVLVMSAVTLLDIGHCQRTTRTSGRAMEAENPFINCVRGSTREGEKEGEARGLLAPSSTPCVQPGQQPKIAPRPDKIPLTLSASCAVPYEKLYFARLYRAHHPSRSRTPYVVL